MYCCILGIWSKVNIKHCTSLTRRFKLKQICLFRRWRVAMSDMIGYNPSYFFVCCWAVITPLICSGVFFFKLATWENLVYQDYHYPWWAHAFGWFMALSSMVCIPGYAAWLWFTTPGTWREVSWKYKTKLYIDSKIKLCIGSD